MASASMPSNSGITPIFSDEEAKTINDYFQNLFKKQHLNLWSTKKTQNYLTITDLDFLHSFILKNIIDIEIKDITEQEKIKKDKFYDFFLFFDNIIKSYKVNILNEKINNNNKNNSKITILNNNSETDLISIINSTISILIEKFILNPEYFNQKDLSITLSGKSFIFMKNDELKSILDNLETNPNPNPNPLVFPSVPTKQIPEVKKTINAITPENAVRDIKNFVVNSVTKEDSEVRKELTRLYDQYGKVFLGTRKTTRVGESNIHLRYQPYHSLLYSNNIGAKLKYDILTLQNHILSKKGGMRKTTKNKTTKHKTTKNKTTKNKTTKNKTIKKKN